MSAPFGRPEGQAANGPDTGFQAIQSTPEFCGPVEPLEGHEGTDHFALVYEERAEQFATVVPYIRQGIERGERCMYVHDSNTRAELIDALREGGVDVDAVLESGQLSFHAAEETYLVDGEVDVGQARELLRESMEAGLAEYEGFRVTAEETWLVDDEGAQREFMTCEAHVNSLFENQAAMALCQYDRSALSPAVIEDVINTHPYLIYDDTACPNDYYTPPEEYFGPTDQAAENERQLETLVDRTAARASLRTREHFERRMYEVTSDPERSFEEKLDVLFDLGCEWFDLDVGGLAKVDADADTFEVEMVNGDHDSLVPGARVDLSETYCRVAVDDTGDAGDPVTITDPVGAGFEGDICYAEFGVRTYLGSHLELDGAPDRTFWFVSDTPRETPFSAAERTFHHLMGQWVQYELERRENERERRERTEYLGALVETTPECIKTVAADGTLVQMNSAGLEMVAADEASDVVGDSVYDLIAPEHRERFREFNERVCAGEQASLEYDIVGLDGTRRHMETHAAPLRRPDGTAAQVAVTRDITDQVEREAAIRQTKDRFKTVFENSDDGIFIIDPDGDAFVDVNPAACEMTGYDRSDLLSRSPSELHADELAQFRAFLEEVREEGSAWTEDLTCRAKDGRTFPTEFTASSVTLDGRDLVLALVRDIDHRKEHERYQRELYEITADPDLSFDGKLERMLELGRDRFDLEMAGLNHLPSWDGKFRLEKGVGLDIGSDEELWTDPSNDCYCRRTIEEEAPVGVVDVRDTDWTEDAVYQEFGITSYLGTRVTSGAAPYGTLWFGSTEPRDQPFSEAERSFIELMGQWLSYEVERREHNESQRELYDITADPDLATDEKIQQLLEVGCDRLNLPVGAVTREREHAFVIDHMNGSHPDIGVGTVTPPMTENYCREVVRSGDSISVGDVGAAGWEEDALYHEFGLECYAGTRITVRGETHGTVFFTSTEPREAFTEAEQAFIDLLGQCVGYEIERRQHKADLEQTIARLEQSNDRLKQFAYAASHDLQEPLRMVSSYLQLLENRYRDDLDQEAREFIDFAVDGADRMRAMVDDLLAFSRVEQAENAFQPVDCDAVVDRVTDDLQIQIAENDARVVADSLPTLSGDAEQLEQLFSNLVSNGIKYNESETPRVEISAARRGDDWAFTVSDNGIGIDPDRTDRIFEVFKRLHNTDEYDGTGIGLSLCQEIVENHGGAIEVASTPGEGSTFRFTLPAE